MHLLIVHFILKRLFGNRYVIDFRLASPLQILAEIGERLRSQRLGRSWTQQELAARAGIALSAVKKLESGSNATLRTLIKVAQALSIAQELSDTFAPKTAVSIAEMERTELKPRRHARRRAGADPSRP
jgi:transcriptional regulator with XRE-family HTH domain